MQHLFRSRTFFVLSALFIVYATTIPWDVAHAPTLEHVRWIPLWDEERGRLWSVPDMVQNVVLFFPFGFFGFLAVPFVRRRGPGLGALLMGLFGLAVSVTVEGLQTMSATRSPSATDLVTNFTGALMGGLAAAIYVRRLKARIDRALDATMQRRPGILILALYFVAVAGGSLAPFIPTLDVGALRHSVRLFLNDPWGPKPVGALLTDGLLFAALAFLATRELPGLIGRRVPALGGHRASPVAAAALGVGLTAALAVVLEAAQLVILGHSPGVQDAVVGVVMAAAGGGLAAVLFRDGVRPATRLGDLTRAAPWLVLAFAVLTPTTRALSPLAFLDLGEALDQVSGWSFVPFWALFRNLNLSTFRNVFEASAVYLPLGYALFALGKPPRVGFFACFLLGEALEVLQIPVANRVFDVTEGLYAGFMGLVGAWVFVQLEGRAGRAPPAAIPDAETVPLSAPPAGGRAGRA